MKEDKGGGVESFNLYTKKQREKKFREGTKTFFQRRESPLMLYFYMHGSYLEYLQNTSFVYLVFIGFFFLRDCCIQL